MRTLLTLVLGIICTACAAVTPCSSVDRTLTPAQQSAWAPAVARQLNVPSVQILKSYRLGGWNIIYADTHQTDEVFLFFAGDPAQSGYVILWSGAARPDEEDAIKHWTLENAPGVPADLATCFAWEVTKNRGM